MTKIAEFNWNITSADTKKHLTGDFMVDKPFEKLIFECSYTPKYLEDEQKGLQMMREALVKADYSLTKYKDEDLLKHMPLANHVSWSVDSPIELVGTKHMHDPNQVITISNGQSTPGFKHTPIYEGRWSFTASLNAVLTDTLSIHVVVMGENDDAMV